MRIVPLCVVLTLALAAGSCTGDPESEPLPELVQVESCAGLIPVGVVYVERMVLALDGLGVDVLTGDAEPPADIAALTQLGKDLDQRAARLGCDVSELNAAIVADTAGLEAGDDPVLAVFLDVVRSGVVGSLPPVAVTTTSAAGGG